MTRIPVPERENRLAEVKAVTGGLMSTGTYCRLYDKAAASAGGTFVEVGTYRGAATIALALGGQASGKAFEVLSCDLLRDGVGLEGADVEERSARLRDSFAAFGVESDIRFIQGTSAELVAAADPQRIDLLLLDGGGRIEADLELLWDRLLPGCAIIIDDVDGKVRVHRRGSKTVVDQKHRITRLLCDRFVEAGFLKREAEIAGTGWYRKGEGDAAAIPRLALPAYHALIKATIDGRELQAGRGLLRALGRRLPGVAAAWRRFRQGG